MTHRTALWTIVVALGLAQCASAQGLINGFAPPATAQNPPQSATLSDRELRDLMAESDKFLDNLDKGGVQTVEKIQAGWQAELKRLNKMAPALEGKAFTITHYHVYVRLGLTNRALNPQTGLDAANGWFARADEVLEKLAKAGPVEMLEEKRAALNNFRAENLLALGNKPRAVLFLNTALEAARKSSFKGKAGEAAIHVQLAAIAFSDDQWQDALTEGEAALAIYNVEKASEPKFDNEVKRKPLWFVAVSKSRLHQNAFPEFNEFLTIFFGKLTPRDEASAFREGAANILDLAPKDMGNPQRKQAIIFANQLLRQAQNIGNMMGLPLQEANLLRQAQKIANKKPLSPADSELLRQAQAIAKKLPLPVDEYDLMLKVAVLEDLAVSYDLCGNLFWDDSEKTFLEAIKLVQNSKLGNDWPGLVTIRQKYAELLKQRGRAAEAEQQLADAKRIADLHNR